MTRDPRDIVTADAFSVAPELLGRPLASPPRRLGAMLVDLVCVALLTGLPAIVLGVVTAAACLRAAFRRRDEGISRAVRWALVAAAAVAFGGSVALTALHRAGEGPTVHVGTGDKRVDMPARDAVAFMAELIALQAADSDDERQAAAAALVQRVRETQADPVAARELVVELAAEVGDPRVQAALEEALASGIPAGPAASPPAPAEIRALADALEANPAQAEPLRRELAGRLAAAELARSRRELRAAETEVQELRQELQEARQPKGLMDLLAGIADDLGLGFGWSIVYFSVLTALWKGRTVGKRLFGSRVARLDGRPLTWWHAFQRAGGYAASLATGLVGFAELIWDPNRQALHDRISRTVVLRDDGRA